MRLPTILIVDDEKDTRDIVRSFLEERLHCTIIEAGDGKEALKRLVEAKCDLMLLDIRMPQKSGMKVLDQLPYGEGILDVIVLTAWDSHFLAEECAKKGAECMPKPFQLEEMYEKVCKMLDKKGLYHPQRDPD